MCDTLRKAEEASARAIITSVESEAQQEHWLKDMYRLVRKKTGASSTATAKIKKWLDYMMQVTREFEDRSINLQEENGSV